jgi:uncharacterized membrane-anchored protein YitT (DUF2179 family)
MKNKGLVILWVVLGVACIMVAFVYWTTPASLLPAFMPGHAAGSLAIHTKHGIAAFVVGLAFFVLAWFMSGKRSAHEAPREDKHF